MTSVRTAYPADLDLPDKADDESPAMVLSPWPDAGAARDEAITRLRQDIASTTPLRTPSGGPDTEGERRFVAQLNHVGETAAAMVEREAPGAPQPIKDEAVIRFAGYLFSARWGDRKSESLGPKSTDFVVNHGPMFRHCGAKGLLSPWKVRRAGAIG